MNWVRLYPLAISLAAGVAVADRVQSTPVWALLAAISSVLIFIGAAAGRRKTAGADLLPQVGAIGILLLCLGMFLMGFATMSTALSRSATSPIHAYEGRVVEIRADALTDERRAGRAFVARVRSSHVDHRPLRATVEVWSARRSGLVAGGSVRLTGKVHRLSRADPFDRQRLRAGVAARVRAVDQVSALPPHPASPLAAASKFRSSLRSVSRRHVGEDAGLLLGLTIGDESLISSRTIESFRDSGLSHLTAVSGANVAIVIAAVVLCARALKMSKKWQLIAGLAAIAFFVLVTRWEPSVLRASFTATIALLAFFFGRRASGLHSLALAFIALLVWVPSLLWSVAFQLSFAASFGILLLAGPLNDRLVRWRIPRWVSLAAAVSISAQVFVLPLLAVHFGRIQPWSVLANVVAAPMVAPITVAGLAAGAIASVSDPAAGLVLQIVRPLLGVLEATAAWFSSLPGAVLEVRVWDGPTVIASLLAAGSVMAIVSARRRAALFMACLVLVVWVGSWSFASGGGGPTGNRMRVTFFDVGQGDAALVEGPDGGTILVDGGPDPGLIASKLRRSGVGVIDVVVVSHAHADHIDGLGGVIGKVPVRQFMHPGVGELPPGAARSGASVSGERLVLGSLEVEVISPTHDLVAEAAEVGEDAEGASLNDASLVIRVRYGRACVLFTGDIEDDGQQDLVSRFGDSLKCELMKAPHHGSARIIEPFVRAVSPTHVAVSVGKNRFGHPTRTAMNMFQRVGAGVLRTDRHSDLIYELDRSGRIEVVD